MATPVGAKTFYGDLKDNVRVRTYEGWTTHNRGTRGDGWGPVHGVMIHHTVTKSTASAIELCRKGRDDLPGPLYQVVVDKEGTCHLIGWGRANHAGLGDDDVLQAVIREQLPFPRPNEANTDGNARFYGIALLNMGDGEDPFPTVQLNAAATAAAILCAVHGWSERSVIGHKEWTPGKPDPRFAMGSFRTRVRTRRRHVDEYFRER